MLSGWIKFCRFFLSAALADCAPKISVGVFALVLTSFFASSANAAGNTCQLERDEDGTYRVALHESAADEMSKSFGDTFKSQAPLKTLKKFTFELIDKHLLPQQANLSTEQTDIFYLPKISEGRYYLYTHNKNHEHLIYSSENTENLDEIVISLIVFSSYEVRKCHWNDENYYEVLLSLDITTSTLFRYCVVGKLSTHICEASSVTRHATKIRKDLERLEPLLSKSEQEQLAQASNNLDILLENLNIN